MALGKFQDLLFRVGLAPHANRFVLTIGDEGAYLVRIISGKVSSSLFVRVGDERGPEAFRPVLMQAPNIEVLVLVDVLEQMYREDQLPKVGRLDRSKVIKRRVEMAFPRETLRAALALGEAGAGQKVLLMALPMTANLQLWMDFLEGIKNPVLGLCLQPLESIGLAARLAPPVEANGRTVWRVLISRQESSGFRQVFETEGNLGITRLTQAPSDDADTDAIALLIDREFRSSLTYLARLGYNPECLLDMVFIADQALCEAVERRHLPVTSLTTLTPQQAAQVMGFNDVGAADTPYSDTLFALLHAAKRSPAVVLASPVIEARFKLHHIAKLCVVTALAMTVGALFYVVALCSDLLVSAQALDDMAVELKALGSQAQTEQHQIDAFPVPLTELQAVDQTEERLAKGQINPAALFRQVATALDPSTRISSVSMQLSAPKPATGTPTPGARLKAMLKPAADAAGPARIDVHVMVLFPTGATANSNVQMAKDINERLQKSFTTYKVELVHPPTLDSKGSPPHLVAEYIMRGGQG